MAYRELELTLQSARDLKNVNLLTRMYVYAVASISGDPMTRQCTPTDTTGGRNPSWNATFRFAVPPSASAAGSSGWLHVLIRSERALGDRDVGEVVVPLAELLAAADGPGQQPPRLASYQVHTVQRGEPRGVLNVSYRLGPVVAPVEIPDDNKLPVVAYPAPQQPFKHQNPEPQQPYQYHPYHNDYASPQQPYQYHPYHDAYASPQQPYQNHPSHDAYASPQQPFKNPNPAPPQQYNYHPPHDAYAPSPQLIKNQTPAAPQPYHHPPHDAYAPPPLSPVNGKSGAHGPTRVYTQIIFNASPTPQSNGIPAKADGPKPKPPYTPTLLDTSSVKTDHSFSKPSYTPTQPNNTGTIKTDQFKPSYTTTQPNTSPVKTDHTWPKPSYTPTQPNTNPAITDHSWPKPSNTPAQPSSNPAITDHSSPKPSYTPAQPSSISLVKTLSQHQDKVTRANSSPKKPVQQDTRVGELAHPTYPTQVSKFGSGTRLDHSTSIGKEQENTKVNDRKTSATQVVGEYGKAKSTPIEVTYANGMPVAKASVPKVVL